MEGAHDNDNQLTNPYYQQQVPQPQGHPLDGFEQHGLEQRQGPLPPISTYDSAVSKARFDASGTPKRAFRRSYKACLNCRERKVRCDLGDLSAPLKPPCLRCRREGKECVFGVSRRGGVNNVRAGLKKKAQAQSKTYDDDDDDDDESSDAAAKRSRSHSQTDTKPEADAISGKELHNTTDALEILAHAARSFPRISDGSFGFGGGATAGSSAASSSTPAATAPAPKQVNKDVMSTVGTRSGTPMAVKLSDSILVQSGILTEQEVRTLVRYFYSTLHQFYPFIPDEFHDADKLAEVPILLAAITTLASRYYSIKEREEESMHVHGKLWDHCQFLISKTVWAEASTRSIGTVFAFLLFSEWNPRAIHQRWHDYANDSTTFGNNAAAGGGGQAQGGEGGVGGGGGTDGITGFGASRRSDRMAWMLIGNGIRLAQDLGLMESEPKVFLATHLSEIVLALRMGRRSMLHQSLNEPIPDTLNFTEFERAKLGLLQLMSLAHETLYGSRQTTRELLKNGTYLTFLSLFGPHLDSWERQSRELLKPGGPSIEKESLLFDFHYARLYIYSLALMSSPDISNMANVAELIPSARFVGMATDAAKELIAVASRVHEDMDMLSKAPIRWVVRIVHATIFLVKSIMLTPTQSLESHRHTLHTIDKIAKILQDSSPDDVHLSSRFGGILRNLAAKLGSMGPPDQSDNDEPQQPHAQPAAGGGGGGDGDEDTTTTTTPGPMPPHQMPVDAQPEVFDYQQQQQQPPPQEQEQVAYQGMDQAQQQFEEQNQNILSMMDMDFDFLMEGTEGLGFVEPLIDNIEQMQRQQQ